MSLQVEASPQLTQLAAAVDGFLDEHGGHEFANHADAATYGEYISVVALQDGDAARNNCYIASCEVLELLGNEAFGGENMHVIAIASEEMYHAALAVWVEDDWYVVDFTARQFDEDLPFPFVAEQFDWKRVIDWHAGEYTGFCTDASDPSSAATDDYWD